jgi:succinate-semialdehyde dehydrogenase/glutarate-semialdehyde dehydrogenase
MKILQEETFGSLLPIVPVRDADEAIVLANATPYGLSASIWTEDKKRGRELSQKIEAGAVLINDAVSHVGACEAPHGGAKASGYSRTHGREGLMEMTRTKYVNADPAWLRKPWWFGYDARLLRQLNRFADFLYGRSFLTRWRGVPGTLGLLRRKSWL